MDNNLRKHMWIINSTIEAWKAQEAYLILPGTVFINEPGGPRGAFLRYADGNLEINNERIDVGDYLPQFLGIIDSALEAAKGKDTEFMSPIVVIRSEQ